MSNYENAPKNETEEQRKVRMELWRQEIEANQKAEAEMTEEELEKKNGPLWDCIEHGERFVIRAHTLDEAREQAMGWGAEVIGRHRAPKLAVYIFQNPVTKGFGLVETDSAADAKEYCKEEGKKYCGRDTKANRIKLNISLKATA